MGRKDKEWRKEASAERDGTGRSPLRAGGPGGRAAGRGRAGGAAWTEMEGPFDLENHQVMGLYCGVGGAQSSQGWLSSFFLSPSKGQWSPQRRWSSQLPAASLPATPHPGSPLPLTFVPDQVVAQEDEQNQQQEDDERHDPADDGVVGAGGRGYRAGVCGGGGRTVRPGRALV